MTDCFGAENCVAYEEDSHVCCEDDGDSLGIWEVLFFIDIVSCNEEAHNKNSRPTHSKVGPDSI